MCKITVQFARITQSLGSQPQACDLQNGKGDEDTEAVEEQHVGEEQRDARQERCYGRRKHGDADLQEGTLQTMQAKFTVACRKEHQHMDDELCLSRDIVPLTLTRATYYESGHFQKLRIAHWNTVYLSVP